MLYENGENYEQPLVQDCRTILWGKHCCLNYGQYQKLLSLCFLLKALCIFPLIKGELTRSIPQPKGTVFDSFSNITQCKEL